ncbi:MAG: hypothetical protein Q7J02_10640, partial [Rhodocyclaceae bacterium]|nr:hypothetical protein [Rhodocyclaceae bacterium]
MRWRELQQIFRWAVPRKSGTRRQAQHAQKLERERPVTDERSEQQSPPPRGGGREGVGLFMFKFLAKLFQPRPRLGAEEIQSAFLEQFRNFRALLTANNNALELMSSAENMLQSGKPFGMAFVRGELTALTVNVYKMVHSLTVLSDGRYRDLHDRFTSITDEIE